MPFARIYKLYFSPDREYVRKLKNLLGFVPGNVHLYKMAFRHKSVAVTIKEGAKNSNERLEFLGDAVLGSVVAELLFKKYPYKDEGFLTEMRSKIVSRANLNQLSRKLGFNELIQFDARMISFPNKQGSLLGDAFEALIGAVYLDRGYVFTKSFLLNRIIKPHVDIHLLEQTETNFKSRLIEWCQHTGKEIVFRQTDNPEGESSKMFSIEAVVDGIVCGLGRDFNKKSAEKSAAEKACEFLKILEVE
ncbi:MULTISPECIES: ribonuclease III [Sphingobacterium]|jgi:ribonuclease III|uniref:Ribonuclease 3 n=1 Tax=Sphingobacterium multivorum TaxID=28454 RepID=A0A2X2IWD5_SPHMU|nr:MULTISPECIES: ribonuclease III [Sphingobacterium]MDF2517159.1 ribonuclease [Sphingobacterium sp.]KKO90221.1 ribonuclease III [Sphingobacterium sp. Ag1]OFV19761.1 ribonuclease III [Sphingobacterium sp. HMSC13C05]QQT43885.1 ribonuclease III [Sphingobacterium multivorum]QQT63362.1 ribonuclease III [Sphingobacterium multivorum]